jgi:hypothetical protein
MFEGKWNVENGASSQVQSIFWFQIPYALPEAIIAAREPNKLPGDLHKTHVPTPESIAKNSVDNKAELDPFQAALLEAGCGGRGR